MMRSIAFMLITQM